LTVTDPNEVELCSAKRCVRQIALAIWTPACPAPRRGEDRPKPIRINLVGRANFFIWLRRSARVDATRCYHRVTVAGELPSGWSVGTGADGTPHQVGIAEELETALIAALHARRG